MFLNCFHVWDVQECWGWAQIPLSPRFKEGRWVGVWYPKADMIRTDSRAAGRMKARVKGKIFQIEIAWRITQG